MRVAAQVVFVPPIIFVSSVQEGDTIIRALEMGGDDCVVRPFDNKILDARTPPHCMARWGRRHWGTRYYDIV